MFLSISDIQPRRVSWGDNRKSKETRFILLYIHLGYLPRGFVSCLLQFVTINLDSFFWEHVLVH